MWEIGQVGDVEAITRLLDEGVDPAAPEECLVSCVVCVVSVSCVALMRALDWDVGSTLRRA
jgi:hypothetical protein